MAEPDANFGKPQPGRPLPPLGKPLPAKPRKVRGGVKLGPNENPGEGTWSAQRWLRLVETAAEGKSLVEGLEYARAGQTRRMSVSRGLIEAAVQGRADRAYVTTLRLAPFTEEQWERVIVAMSEGAMYAAKVLVGELPASVEDVFSPLGLRLLPTEPGEVTVSCTCADALGVAPERRAGFWCKHACCVAYLFAQRLNAEPFVIFGVRGMPGEEISERLRARRTVVASAAGESPVYVQRVPGVSDTPAPALDTMLDRFWEAGPGIGEVDLPLESPAVSHPLLRRLGPSPFQQAAFPLVGLLASCYEAISADALKGDAGPTGPGEGADDAPAESPAEVPGDEPDEGNEDRV